MATKLPYLAVASYVVAALAFLLFESPITGVVIAPGVTRSLNQTTNGLGSLCLPLAWYGLAIWTFWRWKWTAWPVLLGAPLALLPVLQFLATIYARILGSIAL